MMLSVSQSCSFPFLIKIIFHFLPSLRFNVQKGWSFKCCQLSVSYWIFWISIHCNKILWNDIHWPSFMQLAPRWNSSSLNFKADTQKRFCKFLLQDSCWHDFCSNSSSILGGYHSHDSSNIPDFPIPWISGISREFHQFVEFPSFVSRLRAFAVTILQAH